MKQAQKLRIGFQNAPAGRRAVIACLRIV